jgi:hypothetical protein
MKKIIIIMGFLLIFVGCRDDREGTKKFRMGNVVILTDTNDNKKYAVKDVNGYYHVDPIKEKEEN